MKKLLTFLIMITMFLNYDLTSWAFTNERTDTYSVESTHKNSFLIISQDDLLKNNSFEINDNRPSPYLLFLSLLFPGLGQLAIGENGWGFSLLSLAILPVIFMGVVTWSISRERDLDGFGSGFAILFAGIISVTFFAIIYLINLINALTLGTGYRLVCRKPDVLALRMNANRVTVSIN